MSFAMGVDINSRYSQLSVYTENDKNPVPVSAVAGQDFYEVPTVVALIEEQNRWCYGYEAYSLGMAGAAVLVDDLLDRAVAGEIVSIKGEDYPVVDLLELFIKKLLGMANMIAPYHLADVIVFSAELLNLESIALLNSIIKKLSIDTDKTYLMSHSECVHHYMIHQNRELWSQEVLIIDYSGKELLGKVYRVDRNTKPIMCSTLEFSYPIESIDTDEAFLEVVEELTKDRIISAVYLIGDSVLEDKCPKSIAKLCSKRRTFMGRNLYTRGACYASKEQAQNSDYSNAFIFLGKEKLKYNIGVITKDEDGLEEISELLEAGINWYDVDISLRFYLDESREVRLVMIPIDGSDERIVIIRLNEFPKRPPHASAIMLKLVMHKSDVLEVSVADLGFGEIFPSSEMVVEETIDMQVL